MIIFGLVLIMAHYPDGRWGHQDGPFPPEPSFGIHAASTAQVTTDKEEVRDDHSPQGEHGRAYSLVVAEGLHLVYEGGEASPEL